MIYLTRSSFMCPALLILLLSSVLLTPFESQAADLVTPPTGDRSAEPSKAIDSDIDTTKRPAAAAGAPVSSPAAGAPSLGLISPPATTAPPSRTEPPRSTPPAASVPRDGNPHAGRQFALNNCRPCHVVASGQGSEVRFANAPDFRSVAQQRETTPLSLNVWLTNPHPTMPVLQLTPSEAADVIAYIMSLRR
jgi:mono/diheme cytochrome c family protein